MFNSCLLDAPAYHSLCSQQTKLTPTLEYIVHRKVCVEDTRSSRTLRSLIYTPRGSHPCICFWLQFDCGSSSIQKQSVSNAFQYVVPHLIGRMCMKRIIPSKADSSYKSIKKFGKNRFLGEKKCEQLKFPSLLSRINEWVNSWSFMVHSRQFMLKTHELLNERMKMMTNKNQRNHEEICDRNGFEYSWRFVWLVFAFSWADMGHSPYKRDSCRDPIQW